MTSPAWFDFYGYYLGIPPERHAVMPLGELLDLIACYQIVNGATPKDAGFGDDAGIPDIG